MLRVLLDALVDRPEKYTDQERNELLKQANLLTPSILAGSATREEVSNEWMKTAMLAGSVASALISSVVAAGPWLVKIIAGKDNKK